MLAATRLAQSPVPRVVRRPACRANRSGDPRRAMLRPQHRRRMRDRLLVFEEARWKLERQIAAVELAGGYTYRGERGFHTTSREHRARHASRGIRRAMIEEQPARQARCA